jgi:hypothetical protein
MALLDVIAARLGVSVQFTGGMGGMGGGMRSIGLWVFGGFGGGFGGFPGRSAQQIAHCLCALLAALLGGVLARVLFGGQTEVALKRDANAQVAAETPRKSWRWPPVVGLGGYALIVFLGMFASRSAPGFWTGATFFSTCGLLGVIILGAACQPGKRRQIWLGAALFGAGYMTLAFGRSFDRDAWPSLPTDHLLFDLRRWFPPVVSGFPNSSTGIAAANARVWEALEQPVPMRFPEETTLEDLLKHIRTATRSPDGKGIPVYMDPIGMQEAEKSMTSTIRIDLEGVALKTSLRLCLDQLDLSYSIRDGLLLITSKESEVSPVYQDPFLIVGHCLLALLAAGLGAIVAPLICEIRRDPVARAADGQAPR